MPPYKKTSAVKKTNHISKEYVSNLSKSNRSWITNLNNIMKKYDVFVSERMIETYFKEHMRKPNYYLYIDKLKHFVEKKATLNTIRKIKQLFIDKEHVSEIIDVLKNLHEYKQLALSSPNIKYDPKFASAKYYSEYYGLYKNLEQINLEELMAEAKQKKQPDLLGIFFQKESLRNNKDLRENLFVKQKLFLQQYEELVELIYRSAIKGSVADSHHTYGSLKYIEYHGSLYNYNITNLYQLKTRAVLEDVVFRIKGYENKMAVFRTIKKMILEKRNITVSELVLIGDVLSSLPSSRCMDALNLTNRLFESYKQKIDVYKKSKTYTKIQKEIKYKQSLKALFKNIKTFVSESRSLDERYSRFERFVEYYVKLEKIYDPEIVLKRLSKV